MTRAYLHLKEIALWSGKWIGRRATLKKGDHVRVIHIGEHASLSMRDGGGDGKRQRLER